MGLLVWVYRLAFGVVIIVRASRMVAAVAFFSLGKGYLSMIR